MVKIAALKTFLSAEGVKDHVGALQIDAADLAASRPTHRKKAPTKELVANVAFDALNIRSHLSTDHILQLCISEGIEVRGQDKKAVISSILSRDGRFMSSRKEGWYLRKDGSPATNEAPDLLSLSRMSEQGKENITNSFDDIV
jgi:hypothetical protein